MPASAWLKRKRHQFYSPSASDYSTVTFPRAFHDRQEGGTRVLWEDLGMLPICDRSDETLREKSNNYWTSRREVYVDKRHHQTNPNGRTGRTVYICFYCQRRTLNLIKWLLLRLVFSRQPELTDLLHTLCVFEVFTLRTVLVFVARVVHFHQTFPGEFNWLHHVISVWS